MGDTVNLNSIEPDQSARIAGVKSDELRALIRAKRRSILPMVVAYVGAYLGLSILAGFGRSFLGIKVLGAFNLGFALIVGNYVLSWMLAVAYARVSTGYHDPLVRAVLKEARESRGTQ